jgi:hypothetical protein
MNKLQHNQRIDSALVIIDAGITIEIHDVIVWIDEYAYSFAKHGENLPFLTIELGKMKNHYITLSNNPKANWKYVIVL